MVENYKENSIPSKEVKDEDLISKTKEEIAKLQRLALEAKDKGEPYSPNLVESIPEDIGEEEAEMWEKIQNIKTTEEYDRLGAEFNTARSKISQRIEKDPKIKARQELWAYMANKLNGRLNEIVKKENHEI